jgi:hypothetical protein
MAATRGARDVVRRLGRAGVTVAISAVAALVPLTVGPAPAGAAASTARTGPVVVTSAATAAKTAGTEQRSHRLAARTASPAAHRRLETHDSTLRRGSGQRTGDEHRPLPPATGASDPTGPPPSLAHAPRAASHHAPTGRATLTAGRSPPFSCGS